MVSLREVSLGLYGAWRLARLDRAAMALVRPQRDRRLALVLGGGAVLSRLHPAAAAAARPGAASTARGSCRILLVETIGYVIGWAAYPLAALPFCRWVASEERALGFVIAYNWSQVLQTALLLPVAALGAAQVAPPYVQRLCRDSGLSRAAHLRVVHRAHRARRGRPAGDGAGAARRGARRRAVASDAAALRLSVGIGQRAPDRALRPARSGRRRGGRRRRAPRATSATRQLPVAHQLQGADHVAHLVVQERAGARLDRDLLADRARPRAASSVFTGERAWHSESRKVVKSWRPTRRRAASPHRARDRAGARHARPGRARSSAAAGG